MSYRCSLGHPAADWSWHIRVIACRYGHRQHHWSTFLHKNLSYYLLRIPRMSSRHRIPSYKTVWHHGYSPQLPCERSHCSHRSTDSLPIRTPSAKFPPQLPPQLPHFYSGLYDTEEEFYHKKNYSFPACVCNVPLPCSIPSACPAAYVITTNNLIFLMF